MPLREPLSRMHLTQYHGVLAPHCKLRAAVTWALRLKRVFGVEIERCAGCGGKLKIIASIEAPQVIGILRKVERLRHVALAVQLGEMSVLDT